MIKLLSILAIIFSATAPAPEILAKPVPFSHSEVKEHFRAPLWDKGPGHRGIDLALSSNNPIASPFDGEVFFSGKVVNRQVVTLLSNTGLKASFEPVCGLYSKGSSVTKGQAIGVFCPPEEGYEMHCENCVHFSIRNQHGYLNPLLFYGMLRPAVLSG